MNSTVQWGITVLTAASLNLYYLRRDMHERLGARRVAEHEHFPIWHWLIGTALLSVLSLVFCTVMRRHRQQFQHHRTQLAQMRGGYSELSEELPGRLILLQRVPEMLFLVFPLVDFAIWVSLYGSGR